MPSQERDTREEIRSKLERQFVKYLRSIKHNGALYYQHFPTRNNTLELEESCRKKLAPIKQQWAANLQHDRLRPLLQHKHGYLECIKICWFDLEKLTEILLTFVEDGQDLGKDSAEDFIQLHIDEILSRDLPSMLPLSYKGYVDQLENDIFEASRKAVKKMLREERKLIRKLPPEQTASAASVQVESDIFNPVSVEGAAKNLKRRPGRKPITNNRKLITRSIMKGGRADWRNREKLKELYAAQRNAQSQVPGKKGAPCGYTPSWDDLIGEAANKKLSNRLNKINATLRREMFPAKKAPSPGKE